MKQKSAQLFRRLTLICLAVLTALAIPLYGTSQSASAAGTTAYFGLSPSTGSFTSGSDLAINVTVNLANNYNASWADVYFDNSKFQYVSASIGPAYNGGGNISLKSNAFGSYVSISGARDSGGSINGTSILATIRFKASGTGGAYLNFGSKRVVLFPTTEYTTAANNGNYSVVSPPAPTPTPTPTPSPTPAPTPKKPSANAPAQSAPTPSGLQISDFLISDISYTTATLTWRTNKPASTKVNFSTDKSDLYIERSDETLTTEHTIRLTESDIRAASQYFLRITSDDGSGPVTIDGELTTQSIPVIIKITDENNQPLSDVSVTIDDQIVTTDDEGKASFELSNGEITIYVSSGETTREFTAEIEVPTEDSNIQTVTLALSEEDPGVVSNTEDTRGISIWRIIGIILVLLIGGALVFFFVIKQRLLPGRKPSADPLEADSYSQTVAPPALPPQQPMQVQPKPAQTMDLPSPGSAGGHHASIAELVRARSEGGEPVSTTNTPTEPISPTGVPIPKHASLKDMVKVPEAPPKDTDPDILDDPDLPVAPTHKKSTRHPDNDADASQDTLTIPH